MATELARKRHRSPAYPSLSLRDAVEKAKILYEHEKRTAFDPEVALSHWGYEPSSANGMRAIAALKQYGLLIEERADGEHTLKLSELAIDVLIPEEEGGEEHKNYLCARSKNSATFRAILGAIWRKRPPQRPQSRTVSN